MMAIMRRAEKLGSIDAEQFKSLMIQFSRLGWRKEEPHAIAPEAPRAIPKIIQAAYGRPDAMALLAEEARLTRDYSNDSSVRCCPSGASES